MLQEGEWDADHLDVLREYCEHADVVYTRWRNEDGHEFPFSPYDRAAHIGGLDFVGTDVALSGRAFSLFSRMGGSTEFALRQIAHHDDYTFLGIDAITYTRRQSC